MALTLNDWAHAWFKIRQFANVWYNMRTYGSATSGVNWQAMENGFNADRVGFDPDVKQGFDIGFLGQRALVANLLANPRGVLDPLVLQIGRAMGLSLTDPTQIFPLLYDYMALNKGVFRSPPFVKSRVITRGSWTAAATNQGNGTVLRLSVDKYGFPIESDAPDVLICECIADGNTTTNPGQEQFRVLGLPFRDVLARYTTTNSIGLGNNIPASNLVGNSCDATQALVQNPSFASSSGTGGTSTFALTGWTLSSGLAGSMSTSSTIYRRSNVEGTTGKSLAVTATVVLTQTIPAGQLQAALAYMGQIAVNFQTATGSVRVDVGNLNWTVNSGSGGWNLSRATIDKNLYASKIVTTGQVTVTLTVTVTGGTGAILVDDFVFTPWQSIGGKLLWAIGGATNWVVADTATLTDSVALSSGVPTAGIVQTLLAEAYGRSLPAITPDPAPVSLTVGVTSGGTTAKGKFRVAYTFYNGTTDRESLAFVPSVPFTLDGTNDRVALTGVLTGPGGTTKRNFYVVQVDDVVETADRIAGAVSANSYGAFYYVAELADNVSVAITFDPLLRDLTKPLSYCGDM